MAQCELEGCDNDPRYTDPYVVPELPEDDCCEGSGGTGGSGEGHKYTFSSTATGWQVREDGKLVYSYTDKDTNTTYEWQATDEGWLVKDNTGKVIFTYTDKKNKDTTYTFEKTDDCGIKVTDSDGKVVFDWHDDCNEGTTYTFEQTGVDFKVTNDKTGVVVFTYKGTVDTNTTYTWEDYKDGFKVTDDQGTVCYIYDPNLGKDSDGSYAIDTLLTTVFKGHTTISTGQIIGFDPTNLVVGETLVYDGVGTVGVITKDNGDGTYQVTTMTTSPGSRQGVRLGSVTKEEDLPKTCADAEALGWQTPQLGDFAYVIEGEGTADDVISEWLVTNVDDDCNLTWTFSHSFNAGQYQEQSTTSMSGMILTGGVIPGTFGDPIDPTTLIRGVMRNGILLTPDAQGKVNVIVDDSHVIVNALPTTGIVDHIEYVVIDANQKVTGTWVHDNTGWYQTYAAVTQVKAHQVVTELPTTGIEENVEYVVVDSTNKVTGTWVYDPTKGWLQTEKPEKTEHQVVSALPTTGIDDDVVYIVVDDLTDPVNTYKASYIHRTQGWIKIAENQTATAAHIAVTALPTTNINENAEYLVMTDTSDPSTLTGTWVRVNGNWVQTEKMTNGYHIVTALPTTNIDSENTYIVVTDLTKPDDTFQGQYAYDKTTNKWINLASDKTVYFQTKRDGRELDSWYGGFNTFSQSSTSLVIMPVVERSADINAGKIAFNAGSNSWTLAANTRFEVQSDLAANNCSTNWYYQLDNITDNTTIAKSQYVFSVANYGAPGVLQAQFTTPDHDIEVKFRSNYGTSDGKTFVVRPEFTHITFQEIGRVVDPVAYLNDDGNAEDTPVGNIISYMGNDVPKHYLACDGTIYSVGDYPALEAHIVEQFGSLNYFGGNGTSTWAVPDLRGEFLRGTGTNSHTNAKLNGKAEGSGAAVGTHQSATTFGGDWFGDGHEEIYTANSNWGSSQGTARQGNVDAAAASTARMFIRNGLSAYTSDTMGSFSSRPTNTSVKYCIKYETVPKVVINPNTNTGFEAYFKTSIRNGVWYSPSRSELLDITGNTSLLTDNAAGFVEFIAPVEGFYVTSLSSPWGDISGDSPAWLAIYKNCNALTTTNTSASTNAYEVANNSMANQRSSGTISTVVYLKAGDKLTARPYHYAHTKLRWTVSLVQVDTEEKKVAEVMLKPNLWTPGVEQSFGDGVYGMRYQGKFTMSSNTSNVTLDSDFPAMNFLSSGGWAQYNSNPYGVFPVNRGHGGGTNFGSGLYCLKDSGKNRLGFNTSTNSQPNGQYDYDIWVLYTK